MAMLSGVSAIGLVLAPATGFLVHDDRRWFAFTDVSVTELLTSRSKGALCGLAYMPNCKPSNEVALS